MIKTCGHWTSHWKCQISQAHRVWFYVGIGTKKVTWRVWYWVQEGAWKSLIVTSEWISVGSDPQANLQFGEKLRKMLLCERLLLVLCSAPRKRVKQLRAHMWERILDKKDWTVFEMLVTLFMSAFFGVGGVIAGKYNFNQSWTPNIITLISSQIESKNYFWVSLSLKIAVMDLFPNWLFGRRPPQERI